MPPDGGILYSCLSSYKETYKNPCPDYLLFL